MKKHTIHIQHQPDKAYEQVQRWNRTRMSSGVPQGKPTTSRTAALTPSLLAMVGRALCRSGEIVFDLEVTGAAG